MTVFGCGPPTIILGQEIVKNKMSELESYDVEMSIEATMSMSWFGRLLLDKYCLTSERKATSLSSQLSQLLRVMTHPLIMAPRTQ